MQKTGLERTKPVFSCAFFANKVVIGIVIQIKVVAESGVQRVQCIMICLVGRGETLHLRWGEDGNRYYLAGGAERPVFTISLEYR